MIKLSNFTKILIQISLVLMLLLTYLRQNQEVIDINASRAKIAISAEVLYVPHLQTIEFLTLNYKQAAADILWLRTIQYFAKHLLFDRKYQWMIYFVDQIITLDPRFKQVYLWAASCILYGQQITQETVMIANRLYEKALTQFPDDFEAAYRLGMNYYSEMRSDDPEERKKFQKIGLSYFERAANSTNAPPDIMELIRGIAKNMGSDEVLLYYLFDDDLKESDPKRKEILKLRMKEVQQKLEKSGEYQKMIENAKAQEDKRKETMPYLSPLLFEIIEQKGIDF